MFCPLIISSSRVDYIHVVIFCVRSENGCAFGAQLLDGRCDWPPALPLHPGGVSQGGVRGRISA